MRKMTDHEWGEVCFCSIFGWDDWRSRAAIDAMLERRSDADEVTALKAQVEQLTEALRGCINTPPAGQPVSDAHEQYWVDRFIAEAQIRIAARAAEKGA